MPQNVKGLAKVKMRLVVGSVLLLFALIAVSLGENDILTPGATGEAVVKAVADRITASCVFPDDKLFLRRLAYVESGDGLKATTTQIGYYGGLWRVSSTYFANYISTRRILL